MSSGSRKEMGQLIRDLEAEGYEVTRTGSGHWCVREGGTGPAVFMPHSPGDRTGGMLRVERKLKKIGFERKRK